MRSNRSAPRCIISMRGQVGHGPKGTAGPPTRIYGSRSRCVVRVATLENPVESETMAAAVPTACLPEDLTLPAGQLSTVDRVGKGRSSDVYRCSGCTMPECQVGCMKATRRIAAPMTLLFCRHQTDVLRTHGALLLMGTCGRCSMQMFMTWQWKPRWYVIERLCCWQCSC
jgi:hypothetical protein